MSMCVSSAALPGVVHRPARRFPGCGAARPPVALARLLALSALLGRAAAFLATPALQVRCAAPCALGAGPPAVVRRARRPGMHI